MHCVMGTTGAGLLDELAGVGERQPVRGAQLRDRRGADDGVRRKLVAAHMPECEIIELHHDAKLDAPSGTAKRTAELIARGRRQRARADPLGAPARASWRTRRCSSAAWARRSRSATTRSSRESFMPGVLLAVRRVGLAGRLAGGRARSLL